MPRPVMWKWKRRLALAAAACWLAWPAAALPASQRQPLLVLDAGHSPAAPGALGVRGVHELAYNDRLVAQLAAALQKDGWRVRLTRQSGQEMALGQRPALANRLKADVFLSIHHDSAQLQFLEKKQTENGEVYEATRPIRGYSLFVSGQNPQFRNSYCLAESLGEEILALGRPTTPRRWKVKTARCSTSAWAFTNMTGWPFCAKLPCPPFCWKRACWWTARTKPMFPTRTTSRPLLRLSRAPCAPGANAWPAAWPANA